MRLMGEGVVVGASVVGLSPATRAWIARGNTWVRRPDGNPPWPGSRISQLTRQPHRRPRSAMTTLEIDQQHPGVCDDDQLISRMAEGDEIAREELIRRYTPLAHRLAARYHAT